MDFEIIIVLNSSLKQPLISQISKSIPQNTA